MREILNEIKSLRSQVNNLQSQVHEQQPKKNVSSDNTITCDLRKYHATK